VGKLQIDFGTGIMIGRAGESQIERILSKRHPKHPIRINPPFSV
jgi:hypothetical protein